MITARYVIVLLAMALLAYGCGNATENSDDQRAEALEDQLSDVREKLQEVESQLANVKESMEQVASDVDDFRTSEWRSVVRDLRDRTEELQSAIDELETAVDEASAAAEENPPRKESNEQADASPAALSRRPLGAG